MVGGSPITIIAYLFVFLLVGSETFGKLKMHVNYRFIFGMHSRNILCNAVLRETFSTKLADPKNNYFFRSK